MIVAVELDPPATEFGVSDRLATVRGPTMSVALYWVEPCDADIATVIRFEFAVVVIGNWAEMLPFGMLTIAGTVTLELLETTLTNVFPDATLLRVMVPTEDCPPMTLFGETDSPDRIDGNTFSCAVAKIDPWVAVMLAT